MKKAFLLFSVAIISLTASAQSGKVESTKGAKAVFFELGGPGIASFNYDFRFQAKEDGLGARVGAGGFSIDGEGAVFLPVGLNYLLGKDGLNYFELGGGITPVLGTGDNGGDLTSTFGHLNFGYRRQPKEGGFFFRAAINPIFGRNFFWSYYGGISFGYKF
jgi:hypothetical protein